MKKVGLLMLAMALVVAMGSYASADTKGINLSGEIELDAVTRSNATDVNGDASDSRSFARAEVTLNAAADLTSNVSGFVQVENRQGGFPPNGLIGDANSFALEVEQAYIEAKEAFKRELSLKAGIFDVAYDLRGNGDAFFIDFSENVATRDRSVGGWMARWDQKPVVVDVWILTLADLGIEDSDNSDIYGVVVDWEKDKNLVRFLLAYNRDRAAIITGGVDSSFFSVGLGADWFFLNNQALEVYGEFGFQGGTDTDADKTAAVGDADIDHSSLAVYLGAQYNFNVNYSPTVDLSFWYYGDDDPSAASDADGWYNQGHVNNTVIFEETEFGLGMGSGFWTVRLEGGLKPTDNTWVGLSFNHFQATEDFTAANDEKDLGNEVDIRATYNYTSDLSLGLNAGVFMTGDRLALETTGGTAVDDPIYLVNVDTTLKF